MGKYYNKEVMGKRLLEVMAENNDTTYSLGEYLQLSAATISRYTTGNMAPKTTTVWAIAEKYEINPLWLLGTEGEEKYTVKKIKTKKIPLIGTIAAGTPILALENIEDYEVVPEDFNVDFCLRVKGDSMVGARILDGDIVYIKKQPIVENGEIAAVLINGEEATLKRVYKMNGSLVLHAENLNFADIVIDKKESKSVIIEGKAVFFRSEVR